MVKVLVELLLVKLLLVVLLLYLNKPCLTRQHEGGREAHLLGTIFPPLYPLPTHTHQPAASPPAAAIYVT
jgi:hypothetical protein